VKNLEDTGNKSLIVLRRVSAAKNPTGKTKRSGRGAWRAEYPYKAIWNEGTTREAAIGALVIEVRG
jgi:hypothetical protein